MPSPLSSVPLRPSVLMTAHLHLNRPGASGVAAGSSSWLCQGPLFCVKGTSVNRAPGTWARCDHAPWPFHGQHGPQLPVLCCWVAFKDLVSQAGVWGSGTIKDWRAAVRPGPRLLPRGPPSLPSWRAGLRACSGVSGSRTRSFREQDALGDCDRGVFQNSQVSVLRDRPLLVQTAPKPGRSRTPTELRGPAPGPSLPGTCPGFLGDLSPALRWPLLPAQPL